MNRRRAAYVVTTLSVALLLITLAFWVRGYRLGDHWEWNARDGAHVGVDIAYGDICVSLGDSGVGGQVPVAPRWSHAYTEPLPLKDRGRTYSDRPVLGLLVRPGMRGSRAVTEIFIPFWVLAALFAAFPVVRLIRARRELSADAHAASAPLTGDVPDWDAATDQVQCPLCDYNLRGLTEPRCPECGYTFAWPELLDPRRRGHPYVFEHHPRRNLRSFFQTVSRNFRAGGFWQNFHATQPLRTRRLFIYCLLCGLVAFAPAALFIGATIAQLVGQSRFYPFYPRLSWVESALVILGDIRRDQFSQYVIVQSIFMALWPWLSCLSLLIYQQSMRRARIKPGHVARCAIYSGDIVFWNGLWQLLVLLTSGSVHRWSYSWEPVMTLLVAGDLVVFVLTFLRLWSAYRDYMKFRDAFATVLTAQFIVLLAFCIATSQSLFFYLFV